LRRWHRAGRIAANPRVIASQNSFLIPASQKFGMCRVSSGAEVNKNAPKLEPCFDKTIFVQKSGAELKPAITARLCVRPASATRRGQGRPQRQGSGSRTREHLQAPCVQAEIQDDRRISWRQSAGPRGPWQDFVRRASSAEIGQEKVSPGGARRQGVRRAGERRGGRKAGQKLPPVKHPRVCPPWAARP
jgi:hypothetical protein